jgi:hypothetical protein
VIRLFCITSETGRLKERERQKEERNGEERKEQKDKKREEGTTKERKEREKKGYYFEQTADLAANLSLNMGHKCI